MVSSEDVTEEEVTYLLKELADKRIKNVQNILDAIEGGETWMTVKGPSLFKDLIKRKVGMYVVCMYEFA